MKTTAFTRIALYGAIVASAAGCSTTVSVKEFNTPREAGSEVRGIPFRTKERYKLALYRLINNRYELVETSDTVATLANQEQLHLLMLSGSAFSDATVDVKLASDNTLISVTVDSKSKGEEALTELATQAKAASDARDSRETASRTATNTAEDARLAAVDARKDAVLAQIALDTLDASATLKDRTTAELALERAKLIANQKARRAEVPLPYPEAGL